jgi:hypothetical protein
MPTHYVKKRAADVQDFHAALQRELGPSGTCQLPSLPVLFEFQTRLSGCRCQRVLNLYFDNLVCVKSAVETYTFQNFFSRRPGLLETAPRSPQAKAAPASPSQQGDWLLSSGAPLSRVDLGEHQPEEEPMEGMPAAEVRKERMEGALACLPEKGLAQKTMAEVIVTGAEGCVDKTLDWHAKSLSIASDVLSSDKITDLLESLRMKNKELITRLEQMEAALTKGSTGILGDVDSNAEPCPEPPRAVL